MRNFVKKGEVIDYPNSTGSAIKSGDLVVIGNLAGVAQTDIADGSVGAVLLTGVFSIAKAAGAVSIGAKLYYVTADKNLTTTATNNTLVGVAHAAALTGDTTVQLQLTNGI
jgi:predicted RecA/RadA family phage recombinase